jgi:hypothetical protein
MFNSKSGYRLSFYPGRLAGLFLLPDRVLPNARVTAISPWQAWLLTDWHYPPDVFSFVSFVFPEGRLYPAAAGCRAVGGPFA